MNADSEPIHFLIFIISFFSVWFANLLYSPIHKYLRDKKVYLTLLILSIIMLIISVNQIEVDWENSQKVNAFGPIQLISYLILYKLVDFIALKKYNRHMYFSCRLSNYLEDEEAKEATWLEFLMQFLILIISILAWRKFGELIVEKFI